MYYVSAQTIDDFHGMTPLCKLTVKSHDPADAIASLLESNTAKNCKIKSVNVLRHSG